MAGTERKYKQMEHGQARWITSDLGKLVPEHHPAQVIWRLLGKLDVAAFEESVRTFEGQAGSPAWPPRLLLSVWLYAYQQGISSANRLSQMMEWEPGLQWLCCSEVINVHTLCDFRSRHGEALNSLLRQLLAVLEQEGLVDFSTILHDGTKIQARAGKGSAHGSGHIESKLKAANAYMRKVDEQSQEGDSPRQQAARQRAAREQVERLHAAHQEMERMTSEGQPQARVSVTEPEARRMRHTQHGGWLQSYNVQMSTEARGSFVVAVAVTNDQNDTQQLEPALQTVQQFTGRKPERIIADAGYSTRNNIQSMADAGVEFIAPMNDSTQRDAGIRKRHGIADEFAAGKFTQCEDHWLCPAGQELVQIQQKKHHGQVRQVFQADAAVCAACPHKPLCCPKAQARRIHYVLETAQVLAHKQRMQTDSAKQLYAQRSRVAEFPHLRIKSAWGLRRFSLRGKVKATAEMLLMVLAYNFSQWAWASKRMQRAAA